MPLPTYDPVFAHHDAVRDGANLNRIGHAPTRIKRKGILERFFLQFALIKASPEIALLLVTETHKHNLISEALGKTVHVRDGSDTRPAPGGPEVDHHHLA